MISYLINDELRALKNQIYIIYNRYFIDEKLIHISEKKIFFRYFLIIFITFFTNQ